MMGEQYDMLKTWDNMTRMSCEEKMMDTRTPFVFITAYTLTQGLLCLRSFWERTLK